MENSYLGRGGDRCVHYTGWRERVGRVFVGGVRGGGVFGRDR